MEPIRSGEKRLILIRVLIAITILAMLVATVMPGSAAAESVVQPSVNTGESFPTVNVTINPSFLLHPDGIVFVRSNMNISRVPMVLSIYKYWRISPIV